MGPPKHPTQSRKRQGRRRPRRRLCLLKGCKKPFVPRCPQQRYCGEACQKAAAQWRKWRKQQTYRATANGKQHRRKQAKRYRKRVQERRKHKQEEQIANAVQEKEGHSEGNPPATNSKKFPCDRPGCYDLFTPHPCSPFQKFCSSLCRNALRRVIEREIRWGLRSRTQRE